MPRTGRPKSENPKKNFVGLKLNNDEMERLKAYAKKHKLTMSEVLVRGLEIQYKEDEN